MQTNFEETLRNTSIEYLKNIKIETMHFLPKSRKNILITFYEEGIIDDRSIEYALEHAIIEQAKKDYNVLTNKRNFYDNRYIEDPLYAEKRDNLVISAINWINEKFFDTYSLKNKRFFVYADHCARPDCLAYALNCGEFSEKEIERIPFDSHQGSDKDSYINQYHKDSLPEILKKELFSMEKTLYILDA